MQTVIFDVDDTLYDQLKPFRQAVQKQLDHPFTEKEMEVLYKASRKYSDEVFEKHMNGEITALELQTYRITKACEEFHISLTYGQAKAFQEAYMLEQRQIELFESMRTILDHLSAANVTLAVLTNGETEHQMKKIKQLQLSKWIPPEHLFISEAIGYSKPNVAVFEHIEQQLQLNTTETIYIGDSFENDIVGANRAGWHSIWCNYRNRKPSRPDIKANFIIHKPDEILPIISQIYNTQIWSDIQ